LVLSRATVQVGGGWIGGQRRMLLNGGHPPLDRHTSVTDLCKPAAGVVGRPTKGLHRSRRDSHLLSPLGQSVRCLQWLWSAATATHRASCNASEAGTALDPCSSPPLLTLPSLVHSEPTSPVHADPPAPFCCPRAGVALLGSLARVSSSAPHATLLPSQPPDPSSLSSHSARRSPRPFGWLNPCGHSIRSPLLLLKALWWCPFPHLCCSLILSSCSSRSNCWDWHGI